MTPSQIADCSEGMPGLLVAERKLAQQVKLLSSRDKTQLRLTIQFCTKQRSACLGEPEKL